MWLEGWQGEDRRRFKSEKVEIWGVDSVLGDYGSCRGPLCR